MFKFFASIFMGIVTMFSGVTTHSTGMPQSQNTTNSTLTAHQAATATASTQTPLTQTQLLTMAGNIYANGNLPLGDNKYTTTTPQIGYVYLCNVQTNSGIGGAQNKGSWIHGSTWNINQKISVQGKVSWPNATFSNMVNGDTRTLSGNDLPSHTTGTFPIQSTDPAYQIDRNPNAISAQSFTDTLPVNPTYSDTPYCMGGESGIMLTGVALFNGFDAEYRDAPAYEVQDSCDGHPEVTGEYHYHSLSSCINNINETNVIGYALDGFPITGPKVADNKYLTTANLDECHGITSEIMLDGKPTITYHYVMTEDFPYSVSCFRGKPVSLQVIHTTGQGGSRSQNRQGGSMQGGQGSMQGGQTGLQNGQRPQPPQEAFTVCSGKTAGTSCSFTAPRGSVTGTCQMPSGQTNMVCVPTSPEQNQGSMLPQQ